MSDKSTSAAQSIVRTSIPRYRFVMHQIILMIVLAASSSGAAAKWVRVSADEPHAAYVDPATIRKAGSISRMWSVFDYYKAGPVLDNGKPYLSTRAQFEYDCSADRMRPLAVS